MDATMRVEASWCLGPAKFLTEPKGQYIHGPIGKGHLVLGIAQLLSSPSSGAGVAAGHTLGGKGSSMEITLAQISVRSQ